MSRDMRDSPAHVEAPRGRPQGRLRAAVRHRRGRGVPHQPGPPPPAPAPVPRGRARRPRAAVPPAAHQPARGRPTRCGSGSPPCGSSSPPGASTPVPPPSPGTSGARACRSRRPRPSGGSSTPRASSCPSRASARAAPGSASRRRRPTGCGSRTSPTGASPTGAGSRSAPGSTTTPATCSGCTVFRRVAGDDVVATFTAAGDAHGWPAATLTDNGTVYTARFTGGRNGLEHLLAYLGIRQKNGAPGHPQTQGKIERFHQTLKRWLGRQPAARDLAALQAQLDAFRVDLQRAAAAPGDRPADAGRGVPGDPEGRSPRAPAAGATSGCATTPPTARAPSPCAGPAACTTSRSARPMPASGSSPSSTSTRSRSSPSTPARSSRPT